VAGDILTVEISDSGAGFDPRNGAEPVSSPRDGTMGLSIARAVTDEFAIESDGGGTRVVFSKRLSSS
jgi:anti-sigma regulatory factor (Ser/Thr protein kinase)